MPHPALKMLLPVLSAVLLLSFTSSAVAEEPDGEKTLTKLMIFLKQEDPLFRLMAADQLGQMGPAAEPAVSALSHLARNDPDEDVRMIAEEAVKNISGGANEGDTAEPEVRQLIAQLRHQNAIVRMQAAKKLDQLGPAAGAAVPILEKVVLEDPDPDVRRIAARAQNYRTERGRSRDCGSHQAARG